MTQTARVSGTPRDKAPEIPLRGDPIGGDRYWSRDFMQREWDHMWTRVWHIGGLVAQLQEPGDFITHQIGRESILMVRTETGEIKAFYNVCVHRGNRLVHAGDGSLDRFVCAYHSWAFDYDGVVIDAQNPEDFAKGSPCGRLSLKPVQCGTWGGFVWFNLDPKAPSLQESLAPVWDQLAHYNMEKTVRVVWLTAEVNCNWKVIQDNFNESYHLPTLHRELNTFIEDAYHETQFDMYPSGHNRMLMQGGLPAWSSKEVHNVQAPLSDMMRFWDLDPADFQGRGRDVRRALQTQKRKLGKERGYKHYADLSDEQLTDYYHYTLFPNISLTMSSDGFQLLRPQPHPTDPEKCLFDHWFMVPEVESLAQVDTPIGPLPVEPAEHQVFKHGERSLGFVADQDMSIAVGQQLGLASQSFTDVNTSNQERRIHRHHEVLNDYLEGRR